MLSQTFILQDKLSPSRLLKTHALRSVLGYRHHSESVHNSEQSGQTVAAAQQKIWQFFVELVKCSSPELVLSEFEKLFINPGCGYYTEIQLALKLIILSKDEGEFRNTLKRCIYILLNTWIYRRKYKYGQILIEKLSVSSQIDSFSSSLVNRSLRLWLTNFINSQDYEEIKIFANQHENNWELQNWKYRYTSYLLTPQYLNANNSLEQRQAARRLAQHLQKQFKFDLAMYTAHASASGSSGNKFKNPTSFGDQALRLIKTVLAKTGFFNYASLANIFVQQTEQVTYKKFKKSLLNYLIFSLTNVTLVETIKTKLDTKLELLYQESDQENLRNGLFLRTCNRLIEYLTVEKNDQPSELFVLIASQGNPLTLAILILKILLICPSSRTYLDLCMSKLVEYYSAYSATECQWVINFLELSRIVLTIYTENFKYNLVSMVKENLAYQGVLDQDNYRVFCQSGFAGKPNQV